MGNNEDYLDSLLNNVTKKLSEYDEDFEQKKETADAYMTKRNLPPKTMKALETVRENQFLREFEKELKQENVDDFLAAFEAELEDDALAYDRTRPGGMNDTPDAALDLPLLDDLPDLGDLSGAKAEEPVTASSRQAEDDLMVDTFADLGDFVDLPPEEPEPEPKAPAEKPEPEPKTSAAKPEPEAAAAKSGMTAAEVLLPEGMEDLESLFDDEDELPLGDDEVIDFGEAAAEALDFGLGAAQDTILPEDGDVDDKGIMDLLNSLPEDESLSDIGKMLEADEQTISLEDLSAEPENLSHAADVAESRKVSEKKPKPKKQGFFAKLMDLLFGEDEEEAPAAAIEGADDLENISDENMEILKAMNDDKLTEPTDKKAKKAKKEKKKKEKKEKPPKEKKEKKPREKKPKKEKPVKERGPKEKPLPKVPVMLIWIFAISIFALIFIGNSLLSYSNNISAAETSFDRGNYVASYKELAGMKIRSGDEELYEKAKLLAGVQTELDAYYSMMEVRKFDLALDCLVRGLGRAELHRAQAVELGAELQLNTVVGELEMQLADQFNVTGEQAAELYAIDKRDDYSLALDAVLYGLGLKH